jgi:hypothetical protein
MLLWSFNQKMKSLSNFNKNSYAIQTNDKYNNTIEYANISNQYKHNQAI